MEGTSTIHAVIVHHRGKELLHTALHSLLASRALDQPLDLQVVVVANGLQEPLPELALSSPRVQVVEIEATGFSEANNAGVSYAQRCLGPADAYYFVNNDTRSEPDALALQMRTLHQRGAACVGPQLRILGAPDYLNSLGLNLTEDAWGWDEGIGLSLDQYGPLPGEREVLALTGSALLVDAAALSTIGGWTELYGYYFEDLDLCLKARRAGLGVWHVPDALVYHQISASMNEGSQRKLFYFWRNRLLLAWVHWPLPRLARLLGRVLDDEILSEPWDKSQLQRRALAAALRLLPRSLALRSGDLRALNDCSWTRLLEPAGSVPTITLPEACYRQPREELDAGDEESTPSEIVAWPEHWPTDLDQQLATLQPASHGRRVLVLGWGPLPFDEARMNYAPGARSWQLARGLALDGHAVCLVCARMHGTQPVAGVIDGDDSGLHHGVLVLHLRWSAFEQEQPLDRLRQQFEPQLLVGAAPLPSRRALRLAAGELPVWVDLFGDPMAEAQAKFLSDSEHDHRPDYRTLLAELLDGGDRFSAVSDKQRWAVVGQLGLSGRLGGSTAGEELVHVLPCCVTDGAAEQTDDSPDLWHAGNVEEPPAEAPVLLWSGGYNTWCDVDILASALLRLLEQMPELWFVSTGASIEGHDEGSYYRFLERIANSPHRHRCLFRGRLPRAGALHYQRRADLAVVTERPLYERQLGSSGRVLAWLQVGLPAVSADLSELGQVLAREGLGWTYTAGDEESLFQVLHQALSDRDELQRRGLAGQAWARQQWSIEATTGPLQQWARQGQRAGDTGEKNPSSIYKLERRDRKQRRKLRELRERAEMLKEHKANLKEEFDLTRDALEHALAQVEIREQRVHELGRELGEIHRSRLWRWGQRFVHWLSR